MIKIRVFRAIDDIESCQKYLEGHVRVLKVYGITMITSAKTDWFSNPNVYVISAESEDGSKIYGGARVQIADEGFPLPIQEALNGKDDFIHDLVRNLIPKGTAELCGLWNSREVAGYGLGSSYLVRVGVAISSFLKLETLFGLCAPITVNNSEKVGFLVEKRLGDNGLFYYPKEDLIATAVLLCDVNELSTADPIERERILELRNNPVHTSIETGIKATFELSYNLKIERK